jgi:streptomycin 6-kinase
MRRIPEAFAARMIEVHGERGVEWLRSLPALLDELAGRWALHVDEPFAALSYNYVAPAVRADGTETVLKVGVPHKELFSEMDALRLYDGSGMARLLERLRPGTPLLTLADDEAATRVAAQVMRDLWQPVAPDEMRHFPTTRDWAAGLARLRARFGGETGPLPAPLVERAEAVFAELHASAAAPVLLHGDLHHENILRAERAPWLAIDPQALIGEPAYEPGALLRNPLPELVVRPDALAVQRRRITILAETLGLDAARITAWAFVQAVHSAWWRIEDHGHGWEPAIACAELLATVGW